MAAQSMQEYSSPLLHWLDENGHLFEMSGQAPAPSKDFCQLIVTTTQVIFRWWKISHRQAEIQRLHPGEVRECHEDFLHDDRTQSMILIAFGQHIVDYVTGLCQGHIDYFQRLPTDVIHNILRFVDLDDIARVSHLNKDFHKICTSDSLWKILYSDLTVITDELRALAQEEGWMRLYFNNKLQIQLQLRRKRQTLTHEDEVHGSTQSHTYHDEVLPRN